MMQRDAICFPVWPSLISVVTCFSYFFVNFFPYFHLALFSWIYFHLPLLLKKYILPKNYSKYFPRKVSNSKHNSASYFYAEMATYTSWGHKISLNLTKKTKTFVDWRERKTRKNTINIYFISVNQNSIYIHESAI